jgi:zinc transporter, ZIP family
MFSWFWTLDPISQALIATTGTYLLTAIGTTPVLFFQRAPRRLMDALMGAAAGVMVAASCWSLLQPAIEMGGTWPAVIGLAVGGVFIFGLDQLLPHLHPEFPDEAKVEGPQSGYRRAVLLMVAITIHNFPEGLAVGVAFGSGNAGAALALAFGIGLQNIPEGLAIALPLRREGMSRFRAFWYGQLSATVEPIAGVIGCGLVLIAAPVLPYAMAFAAGAMLYVVVEELLPETTRQGNTDVATLGFLSGFLVMMAMDTSLG